VQILLLHLVVINLGPCVAGADQKRHDDDDGES
jgi:hypothetical protein